MAGRLKIWGRSKEAKSEVIKEKVEEYEKEAAKEVVLEAVSLLERVLDGHFYVEPSFDSEHEFEKLKGAIEEFLAGLDDALLAKCLRLVYPETQKECSDKKRRR